MRIRSLNRGNSSPLVRYFLPLVSVTVGTVVFAWCYGVWSILKDTPSRTTGPHRSRETAVIPGISRAQQPSSEPFCNFRRYPPHRYYKLDEALDFLVQDEYIYGEWPILLEPSQPKRKFCVDQSEWLPATPNQPRVWPFADGTNPSILSLQRIRDRGAVAFADQVVELFGSSAAWITTICMTNSQCTWKDTEAMRPEYDLPDLDQTNPNTIRTLLQVYNHDFTQRLGFS